MNKVLVLSLFSLGLLLFMYGIGLASQSSIPGMLLGGLGVVIFNTGIYYYHKGLEEENKDG